MGVAQGLDARGVVAQRAQDLVGMLAVAARQLRALAG